MPTKRLIVSCQIRLFQTLRVAQEIDLESRINSPISSTPSFNQQMAITGIFRNFQINIFGFILHIKKLEKLSNITKFDVIPLVWKFSGNMFPQNFQTRKLDEITVFYVVRMNLFQNILLSKSNTLPQAIFTFLSIINGTKLGKASYIQKAPSVRIT